MWLLQAYKTPDEAMRGREWDEVLPDQDQETWRQILKEYVNLPEIMIPRFCIPSKEVSKSKIRLICLADAAEFAGGGGGHVCRQGNLPRHLVVLSPSH